MACRKTKKMMRILDNLMNQYALYKKLEGPLRSLSNLQKVVVISRRPTLEKLGAWIVICRY